MKQWLFIGFMLLLLPLASAQGRFHPGDVVPEPYLKVNGYEAFFTISHVSETLRESMEGVSYKSDKYVEWETLRYLKVLHRDADGNAVIGELVCNMLIANDLMEIFKALFEAGYPIEKMRLIDHYGGDDDASMRDNNTSCFNQRQITQGGTISKHSYGFAIDINPRYNPYYMMRLGKAIVKPESSTDYLDRSADFPYMIAKGDLCYRLFKQHGFRWGGDWSRGKDYQHFEK